MARRQSRRAFLRETTERAVAGGAGVSVLVNPRPAAFGSEEGPRRVVALDDEIEPLVRLIEETPRASLLEAIAKWIKTGTGYRDLLAALMLAAVRNVEPRPSVGFKFHAVLVVQSIHLAAMAAGDKDRWLPVFSALDYFKDSQARDERERGWTMGPVDESAVPAAAHAETNFVDAMESWDEAAADATIAGLSRGGDVERIWELFFKYGARDYRSIGHKAIDVANSHRVLQVIGWRHAEPILRSLAYALLMHEDGNPAERDAPADRPWRRNRGLAEKLRPPRRTPRESESAVVELLEVIRAGSEDDAADKVAELLQTGVGPRSVWDALFLSASELMIRQPGIVGLHSVTTTNALYYAYRTAQDELTRRLILLQNAAFLPMFRESMRGRGKLRDYAIDRMEPLETRGEDAEAVADIFADVGRDPMSAARKTLGYVRSGRTLKPWTDEAHRQLLLKGTAVHDFKFGMAVLEDSAYVSRRWLGNYLAGGVFGLQGSGETENPLVGRTRSAMAD